MTRAPVSRGEQETAANARPSPTFRRSSNGSESAWMAQPGRKARVGHFDGEALVERTRPREVLASGVQHAYNALLRPGTPPTVGDRTSGSPEGRHFAQSQHGDRDLLRPDVADHFIRCLTGRIPPAEEVEPTAQLGPRRALLLDALLRVPK